jgi:hypothetical protein
LIQLEVDNAKGELHSGSYVEVHLKMPSSGNSVHLPVNTLLFRDKLQVATVVDGKAQLKYITIGRDYGKEVEVVSGVSPGEAIIINPPDSLTSGQEVKVVTPEQKQKEAKKDDKSDGGKKKDTSDKPKNADDGDAKKTDGDDKKP